MNDNRNQHRIAANLPVTIVTVLDNRVGRIVDVSTRGAQIAEASFPPGTRLQVELGDRTLYGRVMWEEGDRMGIRFETPVLIRPVVETVERNEPGRYAPIPREIAVQRPQLRVSFGRREA